jgi:threonine dehydrogenase-like Zn-dependent dehydrogenase
MSNQTLIIESPANLVMREEPEPEPKEGEVLVRTERTLISPGTERMLVTAPDEAGERWHGYMNYPRPTGYCNVGRVESLWAPLGGEEEEQAVRIGDRVLSHAPHSRYAAVAADRLAKVPDFMALDVAPFGVMATFPMLAVHLARPLLGELAVVIGAGIVGNLCAQMAEAAGCRVLLVDPDPFRAGVAEQCGISGSSTETAAEAAEWVRKECAGGVDIVFEASGSPEAIGPAIKMLRRKGRLVLLGSTSGPVTLDLHDDVHTLGLQIIGAQASNMPEVPSADNRWTWQANAEVFYGLVAAGKVRVEPMITDRVKAEALVDTYRSLVIERERPALGIVVTW